MKSSIDSFFVDEGLFRLVVDASPAGMIITDAAGSIRMVNRTALTIFGYPEGELVGQPVEVLVPDAFRDQHVGRRGQYAEHRQPRSMAMGRDLFGRRKDGSQVPVDISLHPIETEFGPFVLANVLDATDRRCVAQERETHQRSERLAMLGQLAGGVAHEIRTPLCVIRNDIFFLRQSIDQLGPDEAECIQEIEQAVGKANRIVSELLECTREGPLQTVETPVRVIVAAALSDAQLPENVSVESAEIPAGLTIHVDAYQIQRILENLLRNASQAMELGGQIGLAVQSLPDRTLFEVTDQGDGIPEQDLDRVFEPLYTTRGNGIGLGLAVSRRYAQRHGGRLTASNRTAGGTCFRLEIPHTDCESTDRLPLPPLTDV